MRHSVLNLNEEEGKTLPFRNMPTTNSCESEDRLKTFTVDIQTTGYKPGEEHSASAQSLSPPVII